MLIHYFRVYISFHGMAVPFTQLMVSYYFSLNCYDSHATKIFWNKLKYCSNWSDSVQRSLNIIQRYFGLSPWRWVGGGREALNIPPAQGRPASDNGRAQSVHTVEINGPWVKQYLYFSVYTSPEYFSEHFTL